MPFDLYAIRTDLAAALTAAGYNAYAYVPEDAVSFPAAIVGNPTELVYGASLALVTVTLPVTIAANATSYEDAQRRLGNAVSIDTDGAVQNALTPLQSANITKVHILGVEPVFLAKEGGTSALALRVIVQVTANRRT